MKKNFDSIAKNSKTYIGCFIATIVLSIPFTIVLVSSVFVSVLARNVQDDGTLRVNEGMAIIAVILLAIAWILGIAMGILSLVQFIYYIIIFVNYLSMKQLMGKNESETTFILFILGFVFGFGVGFLALAAIILARGSYKKYSDMEIIPEATVN